MTEPGVNSEQDGAKDSESRGEIDALSEIQGALRGLRFGMVTVVVHEGAVVQIERLEKKRIRPSQHS